MFSQSARMKKTGQNDSKKPLVNSARNAEASVYAKKGPFPTAGMRSSTLGSNATVDKTQGRLTKNNPTNPRNVSKSSTLNSQPRNFIENRTFKFREMQSRDAKLPVKTPVSSNLPVSSKGVVQTQRPTYASVQQRTKQGGRPSEAKVLPQNSAPLHGSRKTEMTPAKPTLSATPKSLGKVEEAKPKIWNRNYNRTPRVPAKVNNKNAQAAEPEVKKKSNMTEICIQANELEIMNPDIIIGDMKILLPSPELVHLIEQDRNQKRLMRLLKAERKFEPHAWEEKEHLTDLKEFLERAAIKKRPRMRKTVDELEEDRRMIASMDEVFKHPLPKTESISNITQRIKRKEEELLHMFEGFNKIKIPGLSNESGD